MAVASVTVEGAQFKPAYIGEASDGEPFYTKNEWEMEGHRDYAVQRGATFEFFPVLIPESLYDQIG